MPGKIEQNVKLAKYSTLGVGGEAKYFLSASKSADLLEAVKWASTRELPVVIIGGGNNILISDDGFPGLVVVDRACDYRFEGTRLVAESGCNFSKLCRESLDHKLLGLEFGCGIPGSVGGAIIGNAGALGGSISDTLLSVTALMDGKVTQLMKDELDFDYRNTRLKGSEDTVILSATFQLHQADDLEIAQKREMMAQDKVRRARNYSGRTAGSYFKNPPGDNSAGKLIEEAGLKGYRIGGAEVSEMHANVFRNVGEATAQDFYELEKYVTMKVREKSGITLEPEVVKVGKF